MQNKIDKSLFLDDSQKQELKDTEKNLTDEEKAQLDLILASEDADVADIVKNYIEKQGENAVDHLDQIIKNAKKQVVKQKESASRVREEAEMEQLLKRLDEN